MDVERSSLIPFRIALVVAWYDLWIGAYYDRVHRTVYILPLPCLGVKFVFRPKVVVVTVTDPGSYKIRAIKEIRAATGLGLKEAKEATEGTSLRLGAEAGYALAAKLRDLPVAVEVGRV